MHWCNTRCDEYRQYIEKDGALERRFQKVILVPNIEETKEMVVPIDKDAEIDFDTGRENVSCLC